MLDARALGFTGSNPSRPLFRNLTFTLNAGESLALVGPENAAKTMLIRILGGAAREYSGDVLFQGKELRAWSREFFTFTGVVLDPPGLFPQLSVRENLEYHARLYGKPDLEAAASLERCGIAAQANIRAVNLAPEHELLTGLARALMHSPILLCIDAPAEGLSPESADRVAAVIRERKAAGQATVLAASNDAWAAECCDRTLDLGAGSAP